MILNEEVDQKVFRTAYRQWVAAKEEQVLISFHEAGFFRELLWKPVKHDKMNEKPVGRGYTILDTDKHPWSMSSKNIHAHEFHYSSVKFNKKRYKYAYNVKRGYGINGRKDGLIYKNTIASFSHLRSTSKFNWARYFIKFIEQNNG